MFSGRRVIHAALDEVDPLPGLPREGDQSAKPSPGFALGYFLTAFGMVAWMVFYNPGWHIWSRICWLNLAVLVGLFGMEKAKPGLRPVLKVLRLTTLAIQFLAVIGYLRSR